MPQQTVTGSHNITATAAVPSAHQPHQHPVVAGGPGSIAQTNRESTFQQLPQSGSTNRGAASLSLHGAGNGSTKSMNKIRNKARDSPQKPFDPGHYVVSAGPSNNKYTSSGGPNRGGVLSNTLPSPRRRKDLMKELMQEQRAAQQQQLQQQRSNESMGEKYSNGGNLGPRAPGPAALSGLGSTYEQPPSAVNSSTGPPHQNVSISITISL